MEINKLVANKIELQDFSQKISEKKPIANDSNKEYGKGTSEKKSSSDLKFAVDNANKVLFKNNTHLQFRIHEETNEVMVKIVDDISGEVLKEIPPEKMLDMVAKLWEIAGIIVDAKV